MFDQCSLHAHVHSNLMCSKILAIFTATDNKGHTVVHIEIRLLPLLDFIDAETKF